LTVPPEARGRLDAWDATDAGNVTPADAVIVWPASLVALAVTMPDAGRPPITRPESREMKIDGAAFRTVKRRRQRHLAMLSCPLLAEVTKALVLPSTSNTIPHCST
jgi:hypothetical protein